MVRSSSSTILYRSGKLAAHVQQAHRPAMRLPTESPYMLYPAFRTAPVVEFTLECSRRVSSLLLQIHVSLTNDLHMGTSRRVQHQHREH